MAAYTVITPIRHNGKRHEPPAIVDMDEQAAAPHLLSGVLAIPAADTNTQAGTSPQKSATIPAGAIADMYAYAEIPKDSKPSVKDTLKLLRKEALSLTTVEGDVIEAKDYTVNAELRDDAWSLYLSGDYPANTAAPVETVGEDDE